VLYCQQLIYTAFDVVLDSNRSNTYLTLVVFPTPAGPCTNRFSGVFRRVTGRTASTIRCTSVSRPNGFSGWKSVSKYFSLRRILPPLFSDSNIGTDSFPRVSKTVPGPPVPMSPVKPPWFVGTTGTGPQNPCKNRKGSSEISPQSNPCKNQIRKPENRDEPKHYLSNRTTATRIRTLKIHREKQNTGNTIQPTRKEQQQKRPPGRTTRNRENTSHTQPGQPALRRRPNLLHQLHHSRHTIQSTQTDSANTNPGKDPVRIPHLHIATQSRTTNRSTSHSNRPRRNRLPAAQRRRRPALLPLTDQKQHLSKHSHHLQHLNQPQTTN